MSLENQVNDLGNKATDFANKIPGMGFAPGAEELNYIPSSKSGLMPIMMIVGIVGLLLSYVYLFLPSSGQAIAAAFMEGKGLGSAKLALLIHCISCLCTAAGLGYAYLALREGLANQRYTLNGILLVTAIFAIGYNFFYALGDFSDYLDLGKLEKEGLSAALGAGWNVWKIFMILFAIGYFICWLITNINLKKYSGNVGNIGMIGLLTLALNILAALLALFLPAFVMWIVGFANFALSAYFFFLVNKAVVGPKQ